RRVAVAGVVSFAGAAMERQSRGSEGFGPGHTVPLLRGRHRCWGVIFSPGRKSMRGHGRIQRRPGLTRTGWALAALLATAACAKGGDAGKGATADSTAVGAAGAAGGAVPVISIIRAADWIGSEWSEDALKVGLQESDLEQGRDYEL